MQWRGPASGSGGEGSLRGWWWWWSAESAACMPCLAALVSPHRGRASHLRQEVEAVCGAGHCLQREPAAASSHQRARLAALGVGRQEGGAAGAAAVLLAGGERRREAADQIRSPGCCHALPHQQPRHFMAPGSRSRSGPVSRASHLQAEAPAAERGPRRQRSLRDERPAGLLGGCTEHWPLVAAALGGSQEVCGWSGAQLEGVREERRRR